MSSFLLEAEHQALILELQEASRLPEHLGDDFIRAAEIIIHCEGKLVVSGTDKSGCINKKLAATFTNTGTLVLFVHPVETLHGDLGMLDSRDAMLFISYSNSIKELDLIVLRLGGESIPLPAMTGKSTSPLTLATKAVLDVAVEREACPMHLAPTSSTVNTLMPGDTLAMVVVQARDFSEEDFVRSHPAGALDARLLNEVHHLIRRDEEVPWIDVGANVMDAMLELSRTRLGPVVVCNETSHVQGVFTDGDLRRQLVAGGTFSDNVTRAMTRNGVALQVESRAVEAEEQLMKYKVSTAPVMDENGQLVGAINLQNSYQARIP